MRHISGIWMIIIGIAGVSCGSGESGPCEYDFIDVKVQVTDIRPYAETDYTQEEKAMEKVLYHVEMEFDGSSLASELQYLEKLKNTSIDSSLIVRKRIRKGLRYHGTVSEIKSGDCNPLYVTFHHDLVD